MRSPGGWRDPRRARPGWTSRAGPVDPLSVPPLAASAEGSCDGGLDRCGLDDRDRGDGPSDGLPGCRHGLRSRGRRRSVTGILYYVKATFLRYLVFVLLTLLLCSLSPAYYRLWYWVVGLVDAVGLL
jgi:hypothetical protein